MEKFDKTQKEYYWPELEKILKERIGQEKTEMLFQQATELCREYDMRIADLKGFEKTHAKAAYYIAAIYQPLRQAIGSQQAIALLDEIWKPAALETNKRYDKLPPKLFMFICRKVVVTAFGNKAGFQQEDVSRDKKEVRFNVHSCPYVRIMRELGCAEACPIVCRQDEYTYGNLHGVSFERTKTIGRGDELCDFCYRLK